MPKIIERPMSTTHFVEFAFHLIKDEREAENVSALIGDREVMIVSKGMDPDTFMPMLYFAIKNDEKPFVDWMKFVSPLTLTGGMPRVSLAKEPEVIIRKEI